MVTLDEKEARLVLALVNSAGVAGVISGEEWRERANAMTALENKIREAFAPKPPALAVAMAKEEDVKP